MLEQQNTTRNKRSMVLGIALLSVCLSQWFLLNLSDSFHTVGTLVVGLSASFPAPVSDSGMWQCWRPHRPRYRRQGNGPNEP